MAKIPSYLLNLAGEYRICSELNKRGVFATLTYGNRKGADVYAISDRQERALKIEVKTSQRNNFVTNMTRKGWADDPTAPDFWVLFQLQPKRDGTYSERFFVLSHDEICAAQARRNQIYADAYQAKHGKPPSSAAGVDNVKLKDVEEYKDAWAKIIQRFEHGAG